MLNPTRRLGLVSATPLVAACTFLAFAGCSGAGPPVGASHAAGLPLQSIPTRESSSAPTKIYVTNALNNSLTTYKYDGTPTTPSITDSISDPLGVAVDRNGKIYVANGGSGLVTTYDRFGNRTNPTIHVLTAAAVAVDANGKIYVVGNYLVTTYNPDGSQTTPTIHVNNNFASIFGVAVDANGKIYVTYWWFVRPKRCKYSCPDKTYSKLATYNPDGSDATPTIRLISARDVPQSHVVVGGPAIDANGKIYVVKTWFDILSTYRPGGDRTKPIIGGLSSPQAVAVDANGKIFVTNFGNNTVTTYSRHGSPITPTISGLDGPTGVAIH